MSRPEDLLRELRIDRRPGHAPRRRWPMVVALLAALLVLLLVLRGMAPVAVETGLARSAAEAGPPVLLDASGFVTARRIATVSSKITGRVAEVFIEEGQAVAEGDLLARLDPTDADGQLALAEAQLASSQSQLAEAHSMLALAETNLARQQELVRRQLSAQAALDQALAERDARRARLTSLGKAVHVAIEQRDLARIGRGHTEVRAPFAGVIVAKAAQPGEMVSPLSAGGGFTRTGIGTLVDMESLEINVDVNEAYIGRVQPGMPVQALLNAYPDWRIAGSVIAIVPTADRSKATVKVRIALGERDQRIVPDMGVRVSFLQTTDPAAPAITGAFVPEAAIVRAAAQDAEGNGSASVFVVEEGRVRQVPVTLGALLQAERHVLSGLAGGETVVLGPAADLDTGDRVEPKTAGG